MSTELTLKPKSTLFQKILLGVFCLGAFVLVGAEHKLHYLEGNKPDATQLLAPPPLMDSPEQAADMATVVAVHDACSSNQLAAAFSAARFSHYTVTNSEGVAFIKKGKMPKTEDLMRHVQSDTSRVVAVAKDHFKRPRPYVTNPALAVGSLDHEFSYPSGHSSGATAMALVMAELFPKDRDLILAQARYAGWHRVEIGRHYPTDIYAGRVFAQAIVREMKTNTNFLHDLAEAKAELAQVEVSSAK